MTYLQRSVRLATVLVNVALQSELIYAIKFVCKVVVTACVVVSAVGVAGALVDFLLRCV
jgi:hypothetical protein